MADIADTEWSRQSRPIYGEQMPSSRPGTSFPLRGRSVWSSSECVRLDIWGMLVEECFSRLDGDRLDGYWWRVLKSTDLQDRDSWKHLPVLRKGEHWACSADKAEIRRSHWAIYFAAFFYFAFSTLFPLSCFRIVCLFNFKFMYACMCTYNCRCVHLHVWMFLNRSYVLWLWP